MGLCEGDIGVGKEQSMIARWPQTDSPLSVAQFYLVIPPGDYATVCGFPWTDKVYAAVVED